MARPIRRVSMLSGIVVGCVVIGVVGCGVIGVVGCVVIGALSSQHTGRASRDNPYWPGYGTELDDKLAFSDIPPAAIKTLDIYVFPPGVTSIGEVSTIADLPRVTVSNRTVINDFHKASSVVGEKIPGRGSLEAAGWMVATLNDGREAAVRFLVYQPKRVELVPRRHKNEFGTHRSFHVLLYDWFRPILAELEKGGPPRTNTTPAENRDP